jgi:hypothetical protein
MASTAAAAAVGTTTTMSSRYVVRLDPLRVDQTILEQFRNIIPLDSSLVKLYDERLAHVGSLDELKPQIDLNPSEFPIELILDEESELNLHVKVCSFVIENKINV